MKQSFCTKVEWLCKKYRVGNCLEFAYLGLAYLLKLKLGIRVEIFRIGQGDHWFIVLDRKTDSNENKPDTWGDTAVICDPFVGVAYSAKEIFTRLKNYREISLPGGDSMACLVPINVSTQYVECWLSCESSPESSKSKRKKPSSPESTEKDHKGCSRRLKTS